jgi:hypothetical protein
MDTPPDDKPRQSDQPTPDSYNPWTMPAADGYLPPEQASCSARVGKELFLGAISHPFKTAATFAIAAALSASAEAVGAGAATMGLLRAGSVLLGAEKARELAENGGLNAVDAGVAQKYLSDLRIVCDGDPNDPKLASAQEGVQNLGEATGQVVASLLGSIKGRAIFKNGPHGLNIASPGAFNLGPPLQPVFEGASPDFEIEPAQPSRPLVLHSEGGEGGTTGSPSSGDAAQSIGDPSTAPTPETKSTPAIPRRSASASLSPTAERFVQRIFVDPADQARIPLSAGEQFGRPPSRIVDGQLPAGTFVPNETEWRQIEYSRGDLLEAYWRKVRRREAPSLKDAAPPRVQALLSLRQEQNGPLPDFGWMTSRGLDQYLDRLEVPISELDDPHKVALDLGAGAQQEAAKDSRLRRLRTTIASVDPRLDLPLRLDLHSLLPGLGRFRPGAEKWCLTGEEYRYDGRLHPERFTAPNESELPFERYNLVMGL